MLGWRWGVQRRPDLPLPKQAHHLTTAMIARVSLLIAVAIVGCGKTTSTNRVARQNSAPVIASDARIAAFVGDWAGDDGVELSIARSADGSATISVPSNAEWEAVVNNVRFEGTSLRYDLYLYYAGSEDFRTITNVVGDHPYSGVRNEVTLTPGDGPNELEEAFVTEDVPNPIRGTLRRHVGGD